MVKRDWGDTFTGAAGEYHDYDFYNDMYLDILENPLVSDLGFAGYDAVDIGKLYFEATDFINYATDTYSFNIADTSEFEISATQVDFKGNNLVNVGTIGTGTYTLTINETKSLSDKQDNLTFGIADTNSVVIDDADVANLDYAKFTTSGLEGRSFSEVKTDLSLDNVENTALSTWAGTSNITTLGTITTGTWNGTAIADEYLAVDYLPLTGGALTGALSFEDDADFKIFNDSGVHKLQYDSGDWIGLNTSTNVLYAQQGGVTCLEIGNANNDYCNFVGLSAGGSNTGIRTNGVGYASLDGNSGNYCLGFGHSAGSKNNASYCLFIGADSGYRNCGTYSTIIGYGAGTKNTRNGITAIGTNTLGNSDSLNATAVGYSAFSDFNEDSANAETVDSVQYADNQVTITGHGFGSADTYLNLKASTTGTLPTGLASTPVQWKVIDANTLECISDLFSDAGTGTLTLTPQFKYDNSTALGYDAEPTASNQVMLGDTNVTEVFSYGAGNFAGLYVGLNEIGHSVGKGMTFDADGDVTFDGRILYDGGGTNSGAYCLSDSGTAIYSITRQDGDEVGEVSFTSYAGLGFATNVGNTATSTSYSGLIYSNSGVNYYEFATGDNYNVNTSTHLHTIDIATGGQLNVDINGITEFSVSVSTIDCKLNSLSGMAYIEAGDSNLSFYANSKTDETPFAFQTGNAIGNAYLRRLEIWGHADVADVKILNSNLVIGDGGTTDYAQFDDDGVLTLHGAARPEKKYCIPAASVNAPGAQGATYVAHGIDGAWEYSKSVTNNTSITFAIPSDMDRSVKPSLKLTWSSPATTGDVKWTVEYLYLALDEDTDNSTPDETVTQTVTVRGTADYLAATEFAFDNAPSNDDKLCMIRVSRLGGDAADTADAVAHAFCGAFVYTANTLGE